MNIFTVFEKRVKEILEKSGLKSQDDGSLDFARVAVEAPRDPSHGDLSTNAAMVLAKAVGVNPRELAARLVPLIEQSDDVASVNVAGPGFINIRLTDDFWRNLLAQINVEGKLFGHSTMGLGKKVNIEYVSANPTGPLHVGHCRGAVVGDALANLLTFAGFDVVKEYYINDAGGQINVLADSVIWRYKEALGLVSLPVPEGLYPGDYLVPVAKELVAEFGDSLLKSDDEQRLALVKERVINAMMQLIRDDLAAINIHHDVFFSERTLHADDEKAIRSTINDLTMRGFVYKGKLPPPKGMPSEDWEDREQILLRSTDVGDDIDRPLMKSDGTYTYFAADVAYFKDKFERGFNEMVYVLGADHGGYIKRLEAVAKAVAGDQAHLTVLICQLVKLYRNGVPFTMGKRTGNFVTLRDLIDEVGPDPVRFMMLYRKPDAPLDFDFDKVTEQSKDNPVFYVQYASARCHSILRQAYDVHGFDKIDNSITASHLHRLVDESEMVLIRKLAEYPRVIEQGALHQEPHRVAFYLYDLASSFHAHWNKGNDAHGLRFVQADDKEVTLARLGLVCAVRDVIASGLSIIGSEALTQLR